MVWRKGIRVFPGPEYCAAHQPSVMKLHQIVVGLWLLAAAEASAREGYLKTRDGHIFEGHLRFDSNVVVVVNVPREWRVEVSFTNLAELTFLPGNEAEPEALFGTKIPEESGELPVMWSSEDVGRARRVGSLEFRRGKFRVRSAGTNALGNADACHFVFTSVSDRNELVARVSRVQLTDPWARAGLMMRESLAEGARNVFLSISAARGGVFSWRERFGEESGVLLDRGMPPGSWLKLKRDGNVFTALRSPNGIRWSVVERFTMSLSKDCYAGLAVASVRGGVLNESVFEGVEAGMSVKNRWFTPRVELTSGSVKVGHLEGMDDAAVHFENRFGRESVPRSSVANIRFQTLPSAWSLALQKGRTGVLLTSGEFIDGECRGIKSGRVTVSSVPLGLVRYDVNSEVVVAVFRKRAPSVAFPYEVRLNDGSSWRGREMVMERLGVRLLEAALGWQWLPLNEVSELQCR